MRNKSFHNILVFILVSVVMGCTPVKRTSSTEIKSKVDYSEITDELRTQRTKLDAVTEVMSKTKEQLAEWMNESIGYREQKFDSLGRLISVVEQTTSRNGGTTTVKQGDTYVYEGVTVQQVDSIVSEQMKRLRSELEAKSTEKKEPKCIGVFGCIMKVIMISMVVFGVIIMLYIGWNINDRPNLWRKFVNWVRRVFRRRK